MGLALDCNNLGHSRQPLTTIGRLYFYAHTTTLSRLTNAGQLKVDSFPVCFPPKKVKDRSLLRYWAVRAAEIPLRTLSKRLRMSAPGVGYAVERGEAIVKESHYELINKLLISHQRPASVQFAC
jgi:hypothetical protein